MYAVVRRHVQAHFDVVHGGDLPAKVVEPDGQLRVVHHTICNGQSEASRKAGQRRAKEAWYSSIIMACETGVRRRESREHEHERSVAVL